MHFTKITIDHGRVLKKGAVIVLTGLAGVGKTTIAGELHKLLNPEANEMIPSYAKNSSFFHNHLLIDYAKALVCRDTSAKAHMALRESMLDQAIEILKDDPNTDRVVIITGYALMGVDGEYLRVKEMQKYINLARARAVPFVWVHLLCRPDEHRLRVEHSSRKITKIKNYDNLMADIAEEYDAQLEGLHSLDHEGVDTTFTRMDISNMTATESATQILNVVRMSIVPTQDGT